MKEWTPQQIHYGQIPREVLDAELSVLENARKDDSSLPALEKVASNASQQYKRSRPSASKKAAQGAKLLRTSEPHPLFNTGSSDALKRAISGYRPPQSILELKSKDESLGAAAKDFRAKIDRKKALEERRLQAAEAAAEAAAAAPPDDDDDEEEEEAVAPPPPPLPERKRRLSKAERRALKTGQAPKVVPKKASTSFKDATYIQYGDARQEEMDHLLNDARRDDSVRSRRPAVLRRLHAIDATRAHQTRSWVVYFLNLRPFGPRRETAMLRAGSWCGPPDARGSSLGCGAGRGLRYVEKAFDAQVGRAQEEIRATKCGGDHRHARQQKTEERVRC